MRVKVTSRGASSSIYFVLGCVGVRTGRRGGVIPKVPAFSPAGPKNGHARYDATPPGHSQITPLSFPIGVLTGLRVGEIPGRKWWAL